MQIGIYNADKTTMAAIESSMSGDGRSVVKGSDFPD